MCNVLVQFGEHGCNSSFGVLFQVITDLIIDVMLLLTKLNEWG